MGIYLPNMEMPKTCWDCACSIYYEIQDKAMCDITDETLDYILWKRERRPNCPLIEIPTPHGRLGDLDKLKADHSMKNDCAECEKELQGSSRACEYDRIYSKMDFCEWIDNAVTVIEAEGETDA